MRRRKGGNGWVGQVGGGPAMQYSPSPSHRAFEKRAISPPPPPPLPPPPPFVIIFQPGVMKTLPYLLPKHFLHQIQKNAHALSLLYGRIGVMIINFIHFICGRGGGEESPQRSICQEEEESTNDPSSSSSFRHHHKSNRAPLFPSEGNSPNPTKLSSTPSWFHIRKYVFWWISDSLSGTIFYFLLPSSSLCGSIDGNNNKEESGKGFFLFLLLRPDVYTRACQRSHHQPELVLVLLYYHC